MSGLINLAATFLFLFNPPVVGGLISPLPDNPPPPILAQHLLSLNDRIESPYANEIFKENILLNIKYFPNEITLAPGETFAFHDKLLPEYQNKPVKTGFTHFSSKEGFKSVGGLRANGVCHLATLMNWAASEAGLLVFAPSHHSSINGVPKKFWTSIYYHPNGGWRTLNQNLYISNSFPYSVKLIFETDSEKVVLKIIREV